MISTIYDNLLSCDCLVLDIYQQMLAYCRYIGVCQLICNKKCQHSNGFETRFEVI